MYSKLMRFDVIKIGVWFMFENIGCYKCELMLLVLLNVFWVVLFVVFLLRFIDNLGIRIFFNFCLF